MNLKKTLLTVSCKMLKYNNKRKQADG